MTPVDDLAGWLTQVWDEQEELALWAAGWDRSGSTRASGRWVRYGVSSIEGDERQSVIYDDRGQVSRYDADFIAANDPASVLARVAADRQILARCMKVLSLPASAWEYSDAPDLAEATIRDLAQPYADREGFREEWRA